MFPDAVHEGNHRFRRPGRLPGLGEDGEAIERLPGMLGVLHSPTLQHPGVPVKPQPPVYPRKSLRVTSFSSAGSPRTIHNIGLSTRYFFATATTSSAVTLPILSGRSR